MKAVRFTEFRRRASGLLSEVEKGETLLILRHGKPVAEVLPMTSDKSSQPSWKRPALRLSVRGAALSRAILQEREES